MTSTERARRVRRRRLMLAATIVAGASNACGDTPPAPPAVAADPQPLEDEVSPATIAPPAVVAVPRPTRRPAPSKHVKVTARPFRPADLSDDEWRALGELDITAYCPSSGHLTASGTTPREGIVATLDRTIPFGTRLRIQGIGTFTVADRIGHGSEVDIWRDSCDDAITFGRKHLRVWQEAA